jgi:glycosyltransferase involved in cell wall biosynthesis
VRIVYLHQYFNTPAMSGSTRSYEMARRLVQAGHDVHVVTSDQRDARTRGRRGWVQTEEAGIRVHWFNVPYANQMSNNSRIRAFARFAAQAAPKAARLDPDLVVATSTPLTIALPAVYSSRRRRVPMVFEVRDLWPELPIAVGALTNPIAIAGARWLERFAYCNAARIVALSPGMKDGIVNAGYPADQVSVIPNGCDLDLFEVDHAVSTEVRARYSWLGDRPLVVYAGTMGRINGVSYLARLAAATLSRDPNARFLVIGAGADAPNVRRTAEELGVLNRNFFMMPNVPKAEVPAILSAATIATSLFVDLKEMWANSANKFFDALAAKKPVAINYGGWHADLLANGAGLVFDPQNVEDGADKLVAVLRDQAWLRNASEAARSLSEQFSRDRMARELEQVLYAVAPGEARNIDFIARTPSFGVRSESR